MTKVTTSAFTGGLNSIYNIGLKLIKKLCYFEIKKKPPQIKFPTIHHLLINSKREIKASVRHEMIYGIAVATGTPSYFIELYRLVLFTLLSLGYHLVKLLVY